ncbi:MAG: GtrA family protein [Oscillospiraceae bacterium]|nr:GtrA family protein [Oscillospiraceae bacterium]
MNKEFFRKIYRILPKPLCELCMKFENAIIYIFYGALATLINYVSHFGIRLAFTDIPKGTGLLDALRLAEETSRIPSIGATGFAWVTAVIFAFFTNKYFVFEKPGREGMGKEFLEFTGGRLFSLGCELLIMWLFVDVLHLNELVIKLAANVVVLILNYFISKLIVFKAKKE